MSNPKGMKLVTVAYVGDGYLAAADYGLHDESYFLHLEGEEGFEIDHVHLPKEIAEKVVAQGTQEQWYSDGYDAADAVAPFLSTTRKNPTPARTWRSEFGSVYDVPKTITDALDDYSWHNDMSPSFGMVDEERGLDIRIWVEHPNEEEREEYNALLKKYKKDREEWEELFNEEREKEVEWSAKPIKLPGDISLSGSTLMELDGFVEIEEDED